MWITKTGEKFIVNNQRRGYADTVQFMPNHGPVAKPVYFYLVKLSNMIRQTELDTRIKILAASTGYPEQQVLIAILKLKKAGLFHSCVIQDNKVLIQLRVFEYK